jgi:hypothetical protein
MKARILFSFWQALPHLIAGSAVLALVYFAAVYAGGAK